MKCKAPNCDKTDGTYKDLCVKHYAQVRRTGGLIDGYGKAGVCDCGEKAVAKGLCSKHYNKIANAARAKRNKGTKRRWGTASCEVSDCENPHLARGMCEPHYRQQPDRLERGREYSQRRRVRKQGSAIEWPIPADKVQARIDYYGGRCYICGAEDADTIDHVKPIAKGGAHIPANLRPACLSCNSSKRDTWKGGG